MCGLSSHTLRNILNSKISDTCSVCMLDACGCPPPRSSEKCSADWCCYWRPCGPTREHHMGMLWADFLIRPIFIALFFMQREQETSSYSSTVSSGWSCTSTRPQLCAIITSPGTSGWCRTFLEAKQDFLAGVHVCSQPDGGTAVPAAQFGKQTCIKQGKRQGGLKGISTNEEQVAVCISSHPIYSIFFLRLWGKRTQVRTCQRIQRRKKMHIWMEIRSRLDRDIRRKVKEESWIKGIARK